MVFAYARLPLSTSRPPPLFLGIERFSYRHPPCSLTPSRKTMTSRKPIDACRTVTEYFDALVVGDIDRLARMMSTVESYVKIGTDADEVIEGGENALDYYRHHVASAEDFSITQKKLDVQERDCVAWFYTRQHWCLKWCGIHEELSMRMTGVLEKENGRWKFVQIHASVGLPVD